MFYRALLVIALTACTDVTPTSAPPPPDCTADAACDDGLFCNGRETCGGDGTCVSGASPADDGVACTDDLCDEATDGVSHTANDTLCDNGLWCDGLESCDATLDCVTGVAPGVDDGIPCTTDTCDEVNDAPLHTAIDAACADVDSCTADICTLGLGCTHPVICACTSDDQCNDNNGCTDDDCTSAGTCAYTANAAPCDDGLFCNGADTCVAQACTGHAGDPCDGGAECADTCDEGAETCLLPAAEPCTDDGEICTDDACDGNGTCAHPDNTAPCDDGLFCNGDDTCDGAGTCAHTGDPCTSGSECADTCDDDTDECFSPAGTGCTDQTPTDCWTSACDGVGLCDDFYAPQASTFACDDGTFCDGADTCDGAGDCTLSAGDPCAPAACFEAEAGCAVAPTLTAFSASPATLTPGAATPVTWTWSYAVPPLPTPTCNIDFGVGAVTPDTTTSLTLTRVRTFRLTCDNGLGSSTALYRVTVDECAGGTFSCDANASCVDTDERYACACNTGFFGSGEVCSAVVACDLTPALCSVDATCTNTPSGPACVCDPGFVGDGLSCARLHLAFTTWASGNARLGDWALAGSATGLTAADAICNGSASAAGLPGTYTAWVSSSATDAYCRVHGLTSRKAQECGQVTLPASAGPWVRPDFLPFAPRIDALVAPGLVAYYPAILSENGSAPLGDLMHTGTDAAGEADLTCTNWTSNSASGNVTVGALYGGATHWTQYEGAGLSPNCDEIGRLRCLEIGSGPALPPLPWPNRKVFVTSVRGTGDLSSWADAGGQAAVAAGDEICRTRARAAGLDNWDHFEAFLAGNGGVNPASRLASNGPWARLDGVQVATSRTDLFDGRLLAPIAVTEAGAYLGTPNSDHVWTGTTTAGVGATANCLGWTSGVGGNSGKFGEYDRADGNWAEAPANTSCNGQHHLYCFED